MMLALNDLPTKRGFIGLGGSGGGHDENDEKYTFMLNSLKTSVIKEYELLA